MLSPSISELPYLLWDPLWPEKGHSGGLYQSWCHLSSEKAFITSVLPFKLRISCCLTIFTTVLLGNNSPERLFSSSKSLQVQFKCLKATSCSHAFVLNVSTRVRATRNRNYLSLGWTSYQAGQTIQSWKKPGFSWAIFAKMFTRFLTSSLNLGGFLQVWNDRCGIWWVLLWVNPNTDETWLLQLSSALTFVGCETTQTLTVAEDLHDPIQPSQMSSMQVYKGSHNPQVFIFFITGVAPRDDEVSS